MVDEAPCAQASSEAFGQTVNSGGNLAPVGRTAPCWSDRSLSSTCSIVPDGIARTEAKALTLRLILAPAAD